MDKNSQRTLAFLIIIMLFLFYKEQVLDPYVLGPQIKTPEQANNSRRIPGKEGATTSAIPSGTISKTTGLSLPESTNDQVASDQELTSGGLIRVNSKAFQMVFSRTGARLISLNLRSYSETVNSDSPPLALVRYDSANPYPMPLGVSVQGVNDVQTRYELELQGTVSDVLPSSPIEVNDQPLRLVFRGNLPNGLPVEKSLQIYRDNYMFDLNVKVGDGRVPFELYWTRYLSPEDPVLTNSMFQGEIVWFDGVKAYREVLSKIEGEVAHAPQAKWLTISDHYFMATLLPRDSTISAKSFREGDVYGVKAAGANDFQIYAGPKSYGDLKNVGYELQRNVNLGITGFVSAPLIALLHFLFQIFHNYGVAIVLLTIIVRVLTYPLTNASFKQMQAMQALAPEIKRIKETIQDQGLQQQELMGLYKKKGVNPLGGCLPMVLQLPIFIGLYSALSLDVELRHADFAFWITDLSAVEKMPVFGIGIPLMVILMIASMVVQQLITPSLMDPTQKKIMLIMPVFMGFLFMGMPSGLTLYFLTSSVIGIAQSFGMYRGKKPSAILQMTLGSSFAVFLISYVMAKLG